MIMAIVWMLFGAGFYSYTIGSLSSFLSTIDTRESLLNEKLAAANSFVKEAGISEQCKKKIISMIKYNTSKVGAIFSDRHSLFDELPKQLKYEVVMSMYNGIVGELTFFKKKDSAFIVFVMPRMKPASYEDGDYIYHLGEFACEAYVLTRGRVNLVDENEIAYKSYLRGSLVGEVELILKTTRLDSMQVCGETECLTLSKDDLFAVMHEFPGIARDFTAVAKERAKRNFKSKTELQIILKLKNSKGNLNELAGKQILLHEKTEPHPIIRIDSMERHAEVMKSITEVKDLVTGLDQRVNRIEGWIEEIMHEIRPSSASSSGARTVLTNLLKRRRKQGSLDLEKKTFKEDD
mmetsp:Transcript_26194/g.46721  ORF Transcript_26194/g.46721 Transcript_26194/m.46721 type:complete len:349 (-) Transcript_26194:1175-2221(-)